MIFCPEITFDATLFQVVPDTVHVKCLALSGLNVDLAAVFPLPASAQLGPRPVKLTGSPAVVYSADTSDYPRPQESLAGALDHKVREDEHLVEVTVTCFGLSEGVRGGLGEPRRPDERDFLGNCIGYGLDFVLDVRAVPSTKPLAWAGEQGQCCVSQAVLCAA